MTWIILFVSALDGQKWNWESEIFYINKEKKITWHYACFKKKKIMSFHDKIFVLMKKVKIVYVNDITAHR